jgi:hypothetical protein
VFVKSTSVKGFTITNDLRQHIYVKLVLEHDEFTKSTPISQVIPPGQEAGFDIVFCSEVTQQFKGIVTYFINEVHAFKFLVCAQADPVQLDLTRSNLKFNFSDDNLSMEVDESFKITNNGNATAHFHWETSGTGVFEPMPKEDQIEAGQSKVCKVTFSPQGPKPEDEQIQMIIDDGLPQTVKCQGFVVDSNCYFIEKATQGSLDFGCVPVGIRTKEM